MLGNWWIYVTKCNTENSNVCVCVCSSHSFGQIFIKKRSLNSEYFQPWEQCCWNANSPLCFWTHSCITLISLHKHAHTCFPLKPVSFGKGMNPTASQRGGMSLHDIIRGISFSLKSGACNKGRAGIFVNKWLWPWGVKSTGNEHWPHSGVLCMNWHLSLDYCNDVLSRRFGKWGCSYSITKEVFYHNTKAGFIVLHQI